MSVNTMTTPVLGSTPFGLVQGVPTFREAPKRKDCAKCPSGLSTDCRELQQPCPHGKKRDEEEA